MRSMRLVLSSSVAIIAVAMIMSSVLSAQAHQPLTTLGRQWIDTHSTAMVAPVVLHTSQLITQFHFFDVYSYSFGPYFSESSAIADFNRDNRPDIVLEQTVFPTYTSRLVLFQNLGNLQFSVTTIITYATPDSYGYRVSAADLNNDQWPDLVFREGGQTHVLLNNQAGGFNAGWSDSGGAYGALTLADMNGDTYVDILAGQQTASGGKIDLFTNNGSGTNFSPTWHSPLTGAPGIGVVSDIVTTTLNNDAAKDIVATEIYSAQLMAFTGDGSGMAFTQVIATDLGDRIYSLAGGRVNSDTLTDIALNVNNELQIYTAQGGGVISKTWTIPFIGEGYALVFKDFDHDGYDDLFFGDFSGPMYLYLNRPAFGDFQLSWSDSLSPGFLYTGAVADMNGDGNYDLIVSEESILHIYLFLNVNHRDYMPVILRN